MRKLNGILENEEVYMNSRITYVLLLVLLVCSGCSRKESGPTEPSPPTTNATEVEPNDVTPQNLGPLGSTDIILSGSTSSQTDVDRFQITLATTANLHVSLSWPTAADLDVGVMSATGIMLNFQDTGGNPERCTLSSRPAGMYIVQVTSQTSGSSAYVLTIGLR
jgi:hypothetical protein